MTDVRQNCRQIIERIERAAVRSGREPESIKLIAVTKTVSPDQMRIAVEYGIRDIGESRLQEALPKIEALSGLPITWHFIGHVQTNKAKKVAERFDWVHSIDRLELAAKLDQVALRTVSVLLEVKLHEEANKSGVDEASLPGLVEQVRRLPKLRLRGLMAIPPFFDNAQDTRPYFQRLRDLAARFSLAELSMGMSHDFEIAIEEGATMVRVGSAIFGERQ